MLKKLLTYLLTPLLFFSILFQMFGKVWYWVDYELDRQAYIEACINKAKPEMKCNGKCQLMQKMDAGNAAENSTDKMPKKLNLYDYVFNDLPATFSEPVKAKRNTKKYPPFIAGKADKFSPLIFHPPSV